MSYSLSETLLAWQQIERELPAHHPAIDLARMLDEVIASQPSFFEPQDQARFAEGMVATAGLLGVLAAMTAPANPYNAELLARASAGFGIAGTRLWTASP